MIVEYIGLFKEYLLTERRYSSATVDAYLSDLKQFGRYIKLMDFTALSIDSYLENLYGAVTATTLLRKQSVLKQFVTYLFNEGYIRFQYSSDHYATIPYRLPMPLSTSHISALLASPSVANDRFYLRDRLILQWLYGYGLRVSELVTVTLSSAGRSFVEILGKGNKVRRLARHRSEQLLCRQYCEQLRARLLQSRLDTSFLFISNSGKVLTRFGVYAIVQKYASRCGIDHVYPHRFRHSFATHLLEEGAALGAVQTLMGHASIQTTQGYMKLSDQHKRTVFERTHPRS